VGACFNHANALITRWRMRVVMDSWARRFAEVLAVAAAMSLLSYGLPVLWAHCTPKPVDTDGWSEQERELLDQLVPMYCHSSTEYNELASLFFTDADTAIRQLFHFREVGDTNEPTFSSSALFLFFVPYVVMGCVTYGVAVPSGLFVPSLLSGAAFGRLVGHLLHRIDHTNGTFADSGTYALVGAAAVLGGMARMTISLTVILLEATGDQQYVLPLMVTLLCARGVGQTFNEGLYDIHIALKRLPFLEEGAPEDSHVSEMAVANVMSAPVQTVQPVVRVGEVYDLLSRVGHHCFPVVDDAGVMVGTVSRKVITSLIKHRAWTPYFPHSGLSPAQQRNGAPSFSSPIPILNWSTLENVYPRYVLITELSVTQLQRQYYIDLRPYLDPAPYTVREAASLERAYRLFRTLGLRHLPVVDSRQRVAGMVTRVNLSHHHLEACAVRRRRAGGQRADKSNGSGVRHTIELGEVPEG